MKKRKTKTMKNQKQFHKPTLVMVNEEKMKDTNAQDYWMLDYYLKDDVRWVRQGFLTWNQVCHALMSLQWKQMNNRMENYSKEGFQDVEWETIRIHNEKELDVIVDRYGRSEDKCLVKKVPFKPVCTKREFLFDERYQNIADHVRCGEISPSELNNNIPDEPLIPLSDSEVA